MPTLWVVKTTRRKPCTKGDKSRRARRWLLTFALSTVIVAVRASYGDPQSAAQSDSGVLTSLLQEALFRGTAQRKVLQVFEKLTAGTRNRQRRRTQPAALMSN